MRWSRCAARSSRALNKDAPVAAIPTSVVATIPATATVSVRFDSDTVSDYLPLENASSRRGSVRDHTAAGPDSSGASLSRHDVRAPDVHLAGVAFRDEAAALERRLLGSSDAVEVSTRLSEPQRIERDESGSAVRVVRG